MYLAGVLRNLITPQLDFQLSILYCRSCDPVAYWSIVISSEKRFWCLVNDCFNGNIFNLFRDFQVRFISPRVSLDSELLHGIISLAHLLASHSIPRSHGWYCVASICNQISHARTVCIFYYVCISPSHYMVFCVCYVIGQFRLISVLWFELLLLCNIPTQQINYVLINFCLFEIVACSKFLGIVAISDQY